MNGVVTLALFGRAVRLQNYDAFVWPAYALSALALAAATGLTLARARRWRLRAQRPEPPGG